METAEGEARYRLLETVRQYAEERLSDRGETEQLRNRHLGHYVAVAERTYAIWASARQVDADAMFDRSGTTCAPPTMCGAHAKLGGAYRRSRSPRASTPGTDP